ncbi:hypothetical protein BWI93_19205 [Siphonobacter sp. BAB-5385]|uniref:VRR-NUC domain-containing protein n=1 Tax=Siphonobacter sp. BAB-5385 TaxID=1864822 RepID=UPI000B9E8AF8|nr:VRR-NUC domain-containing protein [Siphonobacter sp. BAB-5385]OZI06609.1 hypothetical protein BWI93_19205 [Siphonobacter sp. BAB-5385]
MYPKRNPYEKYLGPEDHVQIQVCNYLRAQYPQAVFYHPPNEGKRTTFQMFKIKILGIKAGFPDLVIFHAGKNLALELKAAKGKPTPEQLEWIAFFRRQGWMAEICKGFDDAKAVIDHFMKIV